MIKTYFSDTNECLTRVIETNKVAMLVQNTSGVPYLLAASGKKEILDDWNGDCAFVPENDSIVERLWLNGEEQEAGMQFSLLMDRFAA